ncbi:hypothetical protein FRC07_003927 [Ceratobasidium sp. 392]|nr:hypothetical protein FRC07_003927 [Ceratobasidium sp. 392]
MPNVTWRESNESNEESEPDADVLTFSCARRNTLLPARKPRTVSVASLQGAQAVSQAQRNTEEIESCVKALGQLDVEHVSRRRVRNVGGDRGSYSKGQGNSDRGNERGKKESWKGEELRRRTEEERVQAKAEKRKDEKGMAKKAALEVAAKTKTEKEVVTADLDEKTRKRT